jgi:hypothetical protein
VEKNRSIDVTKIAKQLPQPAGITSDIFVTAALDLDANERGLQQLRQSGWTRQ